MMATLMGSAQELRQGSDSANRMDKHRQQLSWELTCRLQSWLELTSTGLAMLGECSQQFWDKLLLNLTFSTFSDLGVSGGKSPGIILFIKD